MRWIFDKWDEQLKMSWTTDELNEQLENEKYNWEMRYAFDKWNEKMRPTEKWNELRNEMNIW